jgi:hypothetical protein
MLIYTEGHSFKPLHPEGIIFFHTCLRQVYFSSRESQSKEVFDEIKSEIGGCEGVNFCEGPEAFKKIVEIISGLHNPDWIGDASVGPAFFAKSEYYAERAPKGDEALSIARQAIALKKRLVSSLLQGIPNAPITLPYAAAKLKEL